jgi:hypothetical protein
MTEILPERLPLEYNRGSEEEMNILNILLGFVVLLTGRQVFWLFIAALGFLFGASLGPQFIEADPTWLVWVFAIGLGVVGGLLAVFLKRIAISIAGFAGGWYLMSVLASTYGWSWGSNDWVLYVIGGIIGSGIVSAVYDWALIFLSSIVGALAIVQSLNLDLAPFLSTLIMLGLIIAGISVQSRAMYREQEKASKSEEPPQKKPIQNS